MDSHDVRDPNDLIDEVARAMTSTELARDLRPVVASRLASPAPWTFGWRAGMAAAAVAAVVVVAVVMRPSPEPQRPPTVADASAERATVATPVDSGPETAPTAAEDPSIRRTGRPVARQTILDTEIAEVVDISPVAIVPLEGDDEENAVLTSSHAVEIAPIDVEPVSISGFELVE